MDINGMPPGSKRPQHVIRPGIPNQDGFFRTAAGPPAGFPEKTRVRLFTPNFFRREDKRKIFRDIGFGEARIAKGIMQLAQEAKSEMVRLNAHQLAARCTRMLEEPQASHQGVNIIINCGTEPAGGPGAPARPVNVLVQGSDLPAKPLQITK